MPWDHSLYIAAMAWKKNMWLVGGIPTPLKNVSLSVQITIPCIVEKKKNVPNHQPDGEVAMICPV